MKTLAYKIVRFFIVIFVRLSSHITLHGLENLPTSGAYVVVANHLGRMDVPLVYYILERTDVIMLAAEKYREHFFTRVFFRMLDGIFIDRFGADFGPVREVLARIKAGGVLVLAPEGTRSPTEALIEGRDGASYLAAKTGVPVLPVALIGTEDRIVKQRLKHFQKLDITIWAGKTFYLPPLKGRNREAQLKQHTDEIMCQIGALLPLQYRGVYADHPRLKEILAQQEKVNDGTQN